MDLYKTVADFPDNSYIMALIYSVSSATPLFFPIALFLIWLLGGGASYFAILRSTGRKRFFHVATAFSFVSFILSLLFTSLNGDVIVMSGYWVGFYALMTGLAYLGLSFYK
jgi:Na+-driven multidrug efflux pump